MTVSMDRGDPDGFTRGHRKFPTGAGPDLYPGAEVYGAESVRIDVSFDGVAWTEGAVYTSSNSGLDAGDYRSERDLCDAFHSAHSNTNPYCSSCNSATTNCFSGGGSCLTYGAGICTGTLGGQVCQP